jgi:dTDP-4-amino-4,6-dideoxygalactose transaminase
MGTEEMKYIQSAFDSNWVAPLGPNLDRFESLLEGYIGHGKSILCVVSGTAAIHLALVMLGVESGDEVVCQDFTFVASANPIRYQGATPVFVDSETETWNMSPELLEKAIRDRISKTGRKPKAIIVVDMFGMPAKLDEILDVANRYDIPLLEDSAEAIGSKFRGQPCGTFGRYGIMSFNGNKMITTSGGGALICPSKELKGRASHYATQAREPFPYYQHVDLGYNYRLSNICAGIGCGQMDRLELHLAHHRHLAELYNELFRDVDGISVHLNPNSDFDSNYWLTTIRMDSSLIKSDCNSLCQHLVGLGIECRLLWKPMHMQPLYKEAPAYVNGVSEGLFKSGLCLPSGPWVSDDDARAIVDEIKNFID